MCPKGLQLFTYVFRLNEALSFLIIMVRFTSVTYLRSGNYCKYRKVISEATPTTAFDPVTELGRLRRNGSVHEIAERRLVKG